MMRLACILIAFAVVGTYAEEPEQLVNGVPARIEDYPYAISMQMRGSHMCGGSIIHSNYVITAAHCLTGLSGSMLSSVTIKTGTALLNSGGNVYRIKRVIVHPNYNANAPGRSAGYDIGLIELAQPIIFNQRQQPVRLPTSNFASNDRVVIATWGASGFRQSVHNDLRKIEANCMSPDLCQRYHQNIMEVHQFEFCTLIGQGTGTCNGDSGSGAIRKSDSTILGLVSGGYPCARGYPDVKTSVYPFNGWIRSIVPGI